VATLSTAPETVERIDVFDESSPEPQTERHPGRLGPLSFLTNPYLTLISRLVLGVIFFLSGLSKLGVPTAFAFMIRSYEVPMPSWLVNTLAVGLPPLELGIGVWLLLGLFTRFSGAVSAILNLVFMAGMAWAWAKGLTIDCGCFGGPQVNPLGAAMVGALGPVGDFLAHEQVGLGSILRDGIFLLMSLHLIFVPTVFAVDNWRNRRRTLAKYDEDDYEYEDVEKPQE
jgi:uncharacterized membrane protein YphA (DoxX/SURF4 family)